MPRQPAPLLDGLICAAGLGHYRPVSEEPIRGLIDYVAAAPSFFVAAFRCLHDSATGDFPMLARQAARRRGAARFDPGIDRPHDGAWW